MYCSVVVSVLCLCCSQQSSFRKHTGTGSEKVDWFLRCCTPSCTPLACQFWMSYAFLSFHTGHTLHVCAHSLRSIRLSKTLDSNLNDLASEHMQSIDIGSGGDNPVPTSGGLAGEVDQNQTSHHVSLSDEDSELVHPDADELERQRTRSAG